MPSTPDPERTKPGRIGLLAVLSAVVVLSCATDNAAEEEISADARSRRLHFEAIVIDGHSDTTPRFEEATWRFSDRHDVDDGDMDLPRILDGGLDAQFFSIYMGKREGDGRAIREALERIDAVHRMVAENRERVVLATRAQDIREAAAEGRFAALMGMEGGHIIENNLAALRSFHRLGVRYLTLTHSFHTEWADSSGTREVPEPRHGGLTVFGREVVREMNRLGMMIDVSHVSDETFFDVLEVSRAPVIASHSSTRAVADHPRNMSDEMLRALAEKGGVVMINFYPVYIDEEARDQARDYFAEHAATLAEIRKTAGEDAAARRSAYKAHFAEHPVPQCSLDRLLDHFDHAIAVAGAGHVGLGSDWDGVPSMPVGLEDVSRLPRLTEGLLQRGHDEATVRAVLGGNLLRVMEAVERAAAPAGDALP